MGCATHTGKRGGKFTMKRKRGGGTRKVYKPKITAKKLGFKFGKGTKKNPYRNTKKFK